MLLIIFLEFQQEVENKTNLIHFDVFVSFRFISKFLFQSSSNTCRPERLLQDSVEASLKQWNNEISIKLIAKLQTF